jgi:hypothetical protein
LLVAILGGFRARRADGPPGPRLLAKGLLKLINLVEWERTKRELDRANDPPTKPAKKVGRAKTSKHRKRK